MKKITVKIPAKINLTLDVVGVRDGFHDIESLCVGVNIYDKITVKKRSDKLVTLKEVGIKAGCEVQNNNAYKSAILFMQTFRTSGVDIIVDKSIPVGAGLGGSSADIAGVLLAMQKLFGVKKDIKPLADSLGSDSGYMLSVRPAIISGRGDKVIDLNEKKSFSTNRFYDNVLFGTIDRGISFFQPKVYPSTKRAFAVDYLTVDKKGMTIDMVAEDVAMKAGESKIFDFSLMAYPYRPAEKNWQRLRFRAGKKYGNFGLMWHSHKMFKYSGSLAAVSQPEVMKKYLEGTKGYPMFYQIPMYILESIPQWSYFKDQWYVLPSRGYTMNGGACTKGDYRSKLWQDLYVKNLSEMLRDYP
jgi:hypothetical protein